MGAFIHTGGASKHMAVSKHIGASKCMGYMDTPLVGQSMLSLCCLCTGESKHLLYNPELYLPSSKHREAPKCMGVSKHTGRHMGTSKDTGSHPYMRDIKCTGGIQTCFCVILNYICHLVCFAVFFLVLGILSIFFCSFEFCTVCSETAGNIAKQPALLKLLETWLNSLLQCVQYIVLYTSNAIPLLAAAEILLGQNLLHGIGRHAGMLPACLDTPIWLYALHMFGCPICLDTPTYVWMPPVCFDDVWMPPVHTQHKESMLCQTKEVSICPHTFVCPICLDAPCMLGFPHMFEWSPVYLDAHLYVQMPTCMFGHPHMLGHPPVCLDAPYIWMHPLYIWMPPYVWTPP